MWILVVGPSGGSVRDEAAVSVLAQLGCEARVAGLFDLPRELEGPRPAAVLVEALDDVDAGRAALQRLTSAAPLAGVPVLLVVTVKGLSRVRETDPFDDLVLFPYVPAELYFRIRRAEWKRSDFAVGERIKIGALSIDIAAHEVSVDGEQRRLTQQEFALLCFLCENRGRVFSRPQLLEKVWGVDHYGSSRTVDIHVRRLRMKLGHGVASLETVRGVGYKMKAP